MRTLRLLIRYDGTDFFGWQVQPDRRTVQGEVERALSTLLDGPVRVTAAGRTDRGVHALGQVASFVTGKSLAAAAIERGLNALLPSDMDVARVEEAPEGFHARFSAVSRTYRYRIRGRGNPFRRRYAWIQSRLPGPGPLSEASLPLLGRHNFSAFTTGEGLLGDTTCAVHDLTWSGEDGRLTLEIRADRFLYHMVRLIAGSLVGLHRRGALSGEAVVRALEAGGFRPPFPPAPARGLFFVGAAYPHDGDIRPYSGEGSHVE